MDKNKFRQRVKIAMAEMDLNQTELARKAGVGAVTLNRWLTGKAIPETASIAKIAAVLGKPLSWLIGDDESLKTERVTSAPWRKLDIQELPHMHKIPIVDEKAAAHYHPGVALKSKDFETVDVKYSKKNHFCILATGRSMYPTFSEGDRLVVEGTFLTMEEYDEERGPSDKVAWMRLHENVVLAVINDAEEILVKRLFVFDDKKTGFTLYLQSDNRRVPPIPIRHDSTLKIVGIVKEILRDPKNYE